MQLIFCYSAHKVRTHRLTHTLAGCMHAYEMQRGEGGRGDGEIDRAANGFHMSSLAGVDKWSMRHVSCHARHPLPLPPPTFHPLSHCCLPPIPNPIRFTCCVRVCLCHALPVKAKTFWRARGVCVMHKRDRNAIPKCKVLKQLPTSEHIKLSEAVQFKLLIDRRRIYRIYLRTS